MVPVSTIVLQFLWGLSRWWINLDSDQLRQMQSRELKMIGQVQWHGFVMARDRVSHLTPLFFECVSLDHLITIKTLKHH